MGALHLAGGVATVVRRRQSTHAELACVFRSDLQGAARSRARPPRSCASPLPRRVLPGLVDLWGAAEFREGGTAFRATAWNATVNWLRQMSESGVGVLSGAKGRQLQIVSA